MQRLSGSLRFIAYSLYTLAGLVALAWLLHALGLASWLPDTLYEPAGAAPRTAHNYPTLEQRSDERILEAQVVSGLILYKCMEGICLYSLEDRSYRVIARFNYDYDTNFVYGMALSNDGTSGAYGFGGTATLSPSAEVFSFTLDSQRPRKRFSLSAIKDAANNYVGMEVIGIDNNGNILCEQRARVILFNKNGKVVREITGALRYGVGTVYNYALSPNRENVLIGRSFRGSPDFSIHNIITNQSKDYSIDPYLSPITFLNDNHLLVKKYYEKAGVNGATADSQRPVQEFGIYDLETTAYQKLPLFDKFKQPTFDTFRIASAVSNGYLTVEDKDGKLSLLNINNGSMVAVKLPGLIRYTSIVLVVDSKEE